jgi:acetyl esterase/lipase
MVFLHGGGWITGSTRHYRRLLARFAERGFIVVAPEYRLAPEHPFPQPVEDAAAALAWAEQQDWARIMETRVVAEVESATSPTNPLVLCGDSAGGTLAAALALTVRREVDALLLLYPVLDLDDWLSAWPEDKRPLGMLGRDGRRLMGESYLGASPSQELRTNPLVSPMRASLDGVTVPTLILCGGDDPLLRQARMFKCLLDAAGVGSALLIEPNMPHGFVQCELQPHAMRAIDAACAFAHAACKRGRDSYTGAR